MPNPFRGAVHVVSDPGVGKTSFALGCGYLPEEMAFFDADVRGREVVQQLRDDGHEFAFDFDIVQMSEGKKELERYALYMKCIETMEKDAKKKGLKAIVFDSWSGPFGLESFFHPYVSKNRTQFRQMWSPNGKFAGGQEHTVAAELEAKTISDLLQIAPLVIFTTHTRAQYVNDKRSGKDEPLVRPALIKAARLRLWLRHNPKGKEPIGLVIKGIDTKRVIDGRIATIAVLPDRLEPGTWDKIWEYMSNPVGNRPLRPEERMSEFEVSLATGGLTEDQIKVLTTGKSENEEEVAPVATSFAPTNGLTDELIAVVKQYKAEGMSLGDISTATGLPIGDVMKVK